MHVDRELVEFMPTDEHDCEEIIEEYKEEILIQEGAPEPSVANFADTPPTQGKPRCITLIFEWSMDIYICVCVWYAFTLQAFYGNYMHRYTYLSPTSIGWVAAMLRISVAWVTYCYS